MKKCILLLFAATAVTSVLGQLGEVPLSVPDGYSQLTPQAPLSQLLRLKGVAVVHNVDYEALKMKESQVDSNAGLLTYHITAYSAQKYLPSMVVKKSNDSLSLDYAATIPLIIESLRELNAKIDDLREDIVSLKTDIKNAGIETQNKAAQIEYEIMRMNSDMNSLKTILKPKE